MRYGKLICIQFYSCYLQQCLSVNCFSYWTPCHKSLKGPMNKVCLTFCLEIFLELTLQFSLELRMMLGSHMVLCMAAKLFENNIFASKMGKRTTLGFFEFIEKFSYFFSVWSIMKVFVNCCLLGQISNFEKFWFLRYGPKSCWPIRLQDCKINYISTTKWWKNFFEKNFLHGHTNSLKLKVDWKILGQAWS